MTSITNNNATSTKVKEAFPEFEKPSVAIDIVLTRVENMVENTNKRVSARGLQVLLVKKPDEEEWYLPGTILRLGETPTDAISRIINDKVNINDIKLEQLYTVADNPMRDERGHVISIVYIGIISDTQPTADLQREGYESQWFWVEKPNSETKVRSFISDKYTEILRDLKYDHSKIVDDTISKLKEQLLRTDIGFSFLGKEFTLKELENTFEAVNENVIPGFRRIIANRVENTGKTVGGKAYRPAELFKKKEGIKPND